MYTYIGGLLVDLPRRVRALRAAHPPGGAGRFDEGLPQVRDACYSICMCVCVYIYGYVRRPPSPPRP